MALLQTVQVPEISAYACLAVPFSEVIKKGKWKVAVGRFIGKVKAKKAVQKKQLKKDNSVELEYSHKYTRFAMPQINDIEYDVAVSFLTPHYFAAEKVRAKKKVAWIHTDYSCVDIDIDSERSI